MSWDLALALIALSVLLSAFFAGCETGFTSGRRVRLLHRGRRGDFGSALAGRLIRHREEAIIGAVIGNNVAIVSGTAVATAAFLVRFGDSGETAAAVTMTVLNILFGEILPKALYRAHPERLLAWSAPLYWLLAKLLLPLRWLAVTLAARILRLVGPAGSQGAERLSKERLERIMRISRQHALLEAEDEELLSRFVRNSRLAIEGVMTPLASVVHLDPGARVQDAIRLVRRHGHSRLPLLDEEGDLCGLVLFRDLLRADPADEVAAFLRGIPYLPRTMGLDEALMLLLLERASLAAVVGEDDRPAGIVTLEDLLEPLVGNILDEHDPPAEPA